MAEKINKFIIEHAGTRYEMASGDGGVPPANSVGSEEVKDGSIRMEDLSDEVKDAMNGGPSATDEDIDELFPDSGGKEYADNSDIDELFP